MKDSWLIYGYLQHWWRLLLLCCALGVLVAYLANESTVDAKEYSVTATLAITDHRWVPEPSTSLPTSSPPQALFTIESVPKPTLEQAEADINVKVSRLSEYSGNPVERHNIVILENIPGTWDWWKATTMGAILGLLAAIGMIYVWTDLKDYRKREKATPSQGRGGMGW